MKKKSDFSIIITFLMTVISTFLFIFYNRGADALPDTSYDRIYPLFVRK